MLRAAHERLKQTIGHEKPGDAPPPMPRPGVAEPNRIVTAVGADRLRELDRELVSVPGHFTVHPKLARQLERRAVALDEGGIDWGQAESLAFATLLVEGIPIRLTGQDTERGTFSHRHLVLHDANTGERYAPIQHLDAATRPSRCHNSPLSEYACVGFEYGYSVAARRRLSSGRLSSATSSTAPRSSSTSSSRRPLEVGRDAAPDLPPSARLRGQRASTRAPGSSGSSSHRQDNIRVVNPSTAAQYFHLPSRQALEPVARSADRDDAEGLLRLR
jgi:2-oxoglutarate dehydrogenase E1 component